MSNTMLKSIDDRRMRRALQDQLEQVQQAMEAELPALGRGAAFFACRRLELWQQVAVPLPLPDGVHRGPRPHVRPLVSKDEARILARVAEQVMAHYGGRYLVLAEAPEFHTAVIHDLGKDLRRRLGGEISVEIDARPTEVAAAAERAQRAMEEREELETVSRSLTDLKHRGCISLAGPRRVRIVDRHQLDDETGQVRAA